MSEWLILILRNDYRLLQRAVNDTKAEFENMLEIGFLDAKMYNASRATERNGDPTPAMPWLFDAK